MILKMIRRLPLLTAGWVALVFYAADVLIQMLVLVHVIPYTWVNGGYSASYATQVPISIANIVVALLGGLFVVVASGISGARRARWHQVVAWALTAWWTAGFLMQLLGTPFERFAVSIVLILGVISHLRIAVGEPAC